MSIDLKDAAGLVVSVIGLAFIWFQLRQSANSAKSSLLLSINRDLNSYSDIAVMLETPSVKSWPDSLNALQKERLLDYISYFEGLYLAYRRGLFSLREINDHFAGRFFRLAHNPGVQNAMLTNVDCYGDVFLPIYRLHGALSAYRRRSGMSPLYPSSDLADRDSELYLRMAG